MPAPGRRGSGAVVLVEVECATLEEVEAAVAAGVPRILLDNMSTDELRRAVEIAGGARRARGVRRDHARHGPRGGGDRAWTTSRSAR